MKISEELFNKFKEWFKRDGEAALKGFIVSTVAKEVILKRYEKLDPIDSLPLFEKSELWRYACELMPKGTKEEKIEACRVIYTVGQLMTSE